MKRIFEFLYIILLVPFTLAAQSEMWPVKAVDDIGNALPVYIFLEDGTTVPLSAIFEDGSDLFMDVKGVHNGEVIPVKLISSSDFLVPVKGISRNGKILNVKAIATDGKILDVKGVSRDGNTLNLAAINAEGTHIPLKAISPGGAERHVKGVKFLDENIEMTMGDIKVIAHVKALPTVDVGDVDEKWAVTALTKDSKHLKLIAINDKGREFPINAIMDGKHPYLMNVKAEARIVIHVKLIRNKKGTVLTSIDEFGRFYKVRAVGEDGVSYEVIGGRSTGNVTPIFALGAGGQQYPLKAVSSKGHVFDVKGLKVKKEEVEGTIGFQEPQVEFYAHVKALAPAEGILVN